MAMKQALERHKDKETAGRAERGAGDVAEQRPELQKLLREQRAEQWRELRAKDLLARSRDSLAHLRDSGSSSGGGCGARGARGGVVAERRYLAELFSGARARAPAPVPAPAAPAALRAARASTFLQPRMRYVGYQLSGYKRYQVTVEIKSAALAPALGTQSPHVTGFLTIQGLTHANPQITTFFEGYAVDFREIGFLSSSWAHDPVLNHFMADDRVDLEHWLNFPSFRNLFLPGASDGPLQSTLKATTPKANNDDTLTSNDDSTTANADDTAIHQFVNGSTTYPKNFLNERYIFMRWKERFLVPDAFVESVEGASFDGFYYVVIDQITGNIQGFYYHPEAERFQQLELIPSLESQAQCNSSCTLQMA